MFKRPVEKYGATPAPVTPYQKAAQVWDERIGSSRVQAKNWRLVAFSLLAIVILLVTGLVWQSLQSRVTPYVVEVDSHGGVRNVGLAETPYKPQDAQIAYHLAAFIKNVRGISSDPLIVRQNWLKAYDYATDRAAISLNEYARKSDPFAGVGERSVTVEVTSVVRASERSFQIKWQEDHFKNGAFDHREHWTAILTLVIQQPTSFDQLRKNPLGIYVHGLNWSRDFDAGEKP